MSKSQISWLAVVLALAGLSIMTGHPDWGTITGGAFVLVAGVLAAALVRKKSKHHKEAAKQKVSNSLVTLSAAAIIAVYAVGFQRTRSAADGFDAQAARRKAAAPIAATAQVAALPASEAPATVPPTPIPPSRKSKDGLRVSPPQARTKTAEVAPTEHLQQSQQSVSSSVQPAANPQTESASVTAVTMTPESVPTASSQAQQSASSSAPVTEKPQAQPAAPPAVTIAAEPAPSSTPVTASPQAESAASPAADQQNQYKDGTYLGWGRSRHGDIQASVVIQDGKIVSTAIATCATRYSCSWIAALPAQAVARQGPNVDFVSGATQSSNAFSDGVAEALSKARE